MAGTDGMTCVHMQQASSILTKLDIKSVSSKTTAEFTFMQKIYMDNMKSADLIPD